MATGALPAWRNELVLLGAADTSPGLERVAALGLERVAALVNPGDRVWVEESGSISPGAWRRLDPQKEAPVGEGLPMRAVSGLTLYATYDPSRDKPPEPWLDVWGEPLSLEPRPKPAWPSKQRIGLYLP